MKDLGFERGEITVREGKGDKDRVTTMPRSVVHALQEHLRQVQEVHQQDLADGYGRAPLPHALARKYPNANREWCWQFINRRTCSVCTCGIVCDAEMLDNH